VSRNPTHDERIAHMEYLSQATGITTSADHFLAGVDYARAAVAELIEAVADIRATRGGTMALGVQDARTVRLWAALARVKGGAA